MISVTATAPPTLLTVSWPLGLVALGIAATTLLPSGPQTLVALAAIIVLGVPHGALDGELAREMFRARFGRAWFFVFGVPYLLLAGLVLVAWHIAPIATLIAFLAASVWHFGSEEASSDLPVEILARGGLPVAMAVLAHPVATASLFATVSHMAMSEPPAWMWVGAVLWLGCAAAWGIRCLAAGEEASLIMPALLACAFVALPPLVAFAIYFVCVHAPAHTRALILNPVRGRRIVDGRSAVLLSIPVTALTLLLAAALWPLYGGTTDQRLLSLTIQCLAALTLPHMLFDAWLTRPRRPARR